MQTYLSNRTDYVMQRGDINAKTHLYAYTLQFINIWMTEALTINRYCKKQLQKIFYKIRL